MDNIRALELELPADLARAERTRDALIQEHRKAAEAAHQVGTAKLAERFENEAIAAAEAGTPMPNYAEELAKLEAEQRWRDIAVRSLDNAVTQAGYRLIGAVDGSLDELYGLLRAKLTETLAKVRSVAPLAATLPLEEPEPILRSGDRKAIAAYSTLADASDAIGKIFTIVNHLRTARGGANEAGDRFDLFEDPAVASAAPKHPLSYTLWLVAEGTYPTIRTVEESRAMQAEVDAVRRGLRRNVEPGAVYVG